MGMVLATWSMYRSKDTVLQSYKTFFTKNLDPVLNGPEIDYARSVHLLMLSLHTIFFEITLHFEIPLPAKSFNAIQVLVYY